MLLGVGILVNIFIRKFLEMKIFENDNKDIKIKINKYNSMLIVLYMIPYKVTIYKGAYGINGWVKSLKQSSIISLICWCVTNFV